MQQGMSQLLSSSSSLRSSLPVEDPGVTADLMLADAIGFIRLGRREAALEIVSLLQMDAGLDAATVRVLFAGLELEPSSRDAAQLLKDACAHATLGAREAGLACLGMALACRDVMFEIPRPIERAARALQVPMWMSGAKMPALTIHLS